jgi:hypothetical protein
VTGRHSARLIALKRALSIRRRISSVPLVIYICAPAFNASRTSRRQADETKLNSCRRAGRQAQRGARLCHCAVYEVTAPSIAMTRKLSIYKPIEAIGAGYSFFLVCRIVRMAPTMFCMIALPDLLSYPILLLRAYAEAGIIALTVREIAACDSSSPVWECANEYSEPRQREKTHPYGRRPRRRLGNGGVKTSGI